MENIWRPRQQIKCPWSRCCLCQGVWIQTHLPKKAGGLLQLLQTAKICLWGFLLKAIIGVKGMSGTSWRYQQPVGTFKSGRPPETFMNQQPELRVFLTLLALLHTSVSKLWNFYHLVLFLHTLIPLFALSNSCSSAISHSPQKYLILLWSLLLFPV